MADKTRKVPGSAPGKYYVDDSCVTCAACLEEAPKLLVYTEDKAHVYFPRQPETPAEIEQAEEALESCPTEAVGNDGDT